MFRRMPIAVIACMCVIGFGLSALAAPRWVRVSPTADPARSMYISWNTDSVTESIVQYGLDASYGTEATGSAEDAGADLNVVHVVELTGLSPDTTYHYRVGNPADGWSDDHVFVTGPGDVCTPFSFGIAADNRGNLAGSSACWETVFETISAAGVDFVINSGDLVREGKNASEWVDFLNRSEPWMDAIAIVPAIGNHDDDDVAGDGANYNRVFALPRNSANNTEDFYSFDYGNVHFACLSTHSFDFQTQYDWLDQDLTATDRMWKVVFFHVPVYSSGDHGSNEDGKSWGYIPLFDQYHVDLVINGHDHIYERYRPINNHQEVGSYDDGTCYMVSGGGGAAMDPLYWFRTKEDGLETGDALHHWIKITVTNNVMHLKAERVSGAGCLQGGQGVIDEFDIVKTLDSDPCTGPTDVDGDGFSPPTDCDDNDASVHPGAEEICEDGIDQNCDGADLDCPCDDADGDGYSDEACGGEDCDDGDAGVRPGAIEICGDGVDQDCDGDIDEGDCELCTDADGDGYPAIEASCPSGDDCDDSNPAVYPGGHEWCNGIDDNCDGQTDEGDVCDTCQDIDGDGHDGQSQGCPDGDDCDDGDSGIHPGADEVCNEIDDDCDGATDEDDVCGGNCADETCNLVDDDCDGLTDEDLGYLDCGTGACYAQVPVCLNGELLQCHPGIPPEDTETSCDDEVDNDCDGYIDGKDDDCKPASGCGCAASPGGEPDTPALPGMLLLALACGSLRCRRKR